MAKKILSLAASVVICGTVAQAGETLVDAFKDGKVNGQIRLFYIDRNYNTDTHRAGVALGGHLKYETAKLKGFSTGIAFYTTNSVGLDSDNLPGTSIDPTLFGEDKENYTVTGEAYLKYNYNKLMVKAGRQIINTPMLKAFDVRMVPNFYEAYLLNSKDLDGFDFTLAHVVKFNAGTFANTYKGGISAATGGYSYINADMGIFSNIGEYSIGVSTDGITLGGVKYSGIKNLKVEAWDYYVHDILNALYLQSSYALEFGVLKLTTSAQFIKENDVGSALVKAKDLGNIDFDKVNSTYGAIKVGANYDKSLSGYIAYSVTGSDANNAKGSSIINMWGSTTGFTGGMVSHQELYADTKAVKVALKYDFKKLGVNLNALVYHCNFDMGEDNGYVNGTAWTAKESGFDIKYKPSSVKNLQLRFRGNFPRDFKENLDWDEYRFIVNYNF